MGVDTLTEEDTLMVAAHLMAVAHQEEVAHPTAVAHQGEAAHPTAVVSQEEAAHQEEARLTVVEAIPTTRLRLHALSRSPQLPSRAGQLKTY